MPDIDDIDDDGIPESAFTGDAPKRPEKERKGGNHPTGPRCPECPKGEDGYVPHTWANATRKGHPYYRCSKCGGCWWPLDEDMRRLDPAKKWPPFEKEKQQ